MRARIELLADYRARSGVLHPAGSTIEVDRDDAARLVALHLAQPAAEPPPRAHRPPEALAIAQRRAFSC